MMKKLRLVLTDYWFNEIKSGRKTHEYREAKPFWHKRIGWIRDAFELKSYDEDLYADILIPTVVFQKAFRKDPELMEFEIKNCTCHDGENTDLKFNKLVYDIELGKRIK